MSAALLDSPARLRSIPVPSRAALWTGRVLTGIVALLLAFDSVTKILALPWVVQGSAQAGWSADLIPVIGWIGAVCLVLYLIPRTAPLGAVLWTGYFGGAVATNLRLHMPLFSYTLAPVYVAVFIWGALYLRDARVRRVLGPAR